MQRTAGRSAFPLPMTTTSDMQPRAPSPAVAHLVLVRPMQHTKRNWAISSLPRLRLAIVTGIMIVLTIDVFADTLSRLSDVFTYMPAPRYPVDAWVRTSTGSKRVEGRVICRATLNGDGIVAHVEITKSSGSKILDHAATEALGRWRAKQGRPGRFYDIPITFNGRDSTPELPVPNDGLGLSRGRG